MIPLSKARFCDSGTFLIMLPFPDIGTFSRQFNIFAFGGLKLLFARRRLLLCVIYVLKLHWLK